MTSKNILNKKKFLNSWKLEINVLDPLEVRIVLSSQNNRVEHKFSTRDLSETLVAETKKFLKKQKVELDQLQSIVVVPGSGFSRTRTAVSTANALAFGLKINQKMIKPTYDREPNITWPK
jgi:tRNA A37 threonylcarbamoyladenosine modification protein TsaB